MVGSDIRTRVTDASQALKSAIGSFQKYIFDFNWYETIYTTIIYAHLFLIPVLLLLGWKNTDVYLWGAHLYYLPILLAYLAVHLTYEYTHPKQSMSNKTGTMYKLLNGAAFVLLSLSLIPNVMFFVKCSIDVYHVDKQRWNPTYAYGVSNITNSDWKASPIMGNSENLWLFSIWWAACMLMIILTFVALVVAWQMSYVKEGIKATLLYLNMYGDNKGLGLGYDLFRIVFGEEINHEDKRTKESDSLYEKGGQADYDSYMKEKVGTKHDNYQHMKGRKNK